MSDLRAYAKQQSVSRATDDTWVALRASRDGSPIVMPWKMALVIEGKVYQVRAGTITAPLTGDVAITDTAAEMCADAPSASAIIPLNLNAQLESLNGGTVPEVTSKSVASVSTSGTAFTPLPMRVGGPASTATARVQAAGSVTVTAELATTTLRHYSFSLTTIDANPAAPNVVYEPPPVLIGPACHYVQVAGAGAGPLYFASFDFVDLLTSEIT